MNAVTIIIPVYNAAEQLRKCLESVFSNTVLSEESRLLVIDDGSSEKELEEIYAASARPFVRIVKNSENIGYTRTINRAAKIAESSDVVLLNSDTIVTPNWLEKLRRHANSVPTIGTVTPVSNNAGSFSVPNPGANALPTGLTIAEMAAIVEDCGKDQSFAAPTGNGFCLYIRRALIDAIGYFDEINFPRGYGEENDFCMRAYYAGFLNLVALDTYIWHSAHASFGQSRNRLLQNGLDMMAALYPDYFKLTRVFATNQHFAKLRECVARQSLGRGQKTFQADRLAFHLGKSLKILKKGCKFSAAAFRYLLRHGLRHTSRKIGAHARDLLGSGNLQTAMGKLKSINGALKSCDEFESRKMAFAPDDLGNIENRAEINTLLDGVSSLECIIDHNCGGGANSYSRKRIGEILKAGKGVLYLAHAPALPFVYAILYAGSRKKVFRPQSLEEIFSQQWLAVDRVIVNELVSWFQKDNGASELAAARNVMGQIADYAKIRAIPLEYLVHDYYCVCPSYTLMDKSGIFCGLPQNAACDKCLKNFQGKNMSIREWRETYEPLFGQASEIVCFSQASRKIVSGIFPAFGHKIEVRPHAPLVKSAINYQLPDKGPMSIAVIGNIGVHKGLEIVRKMAGMLKPEERLVVIGECENFTCQENVIFHGTYQRENLPDILKQYHITVGLIPSVWPETFCYVAQECMQLGLPLVTFDLGAQGERTAQYEKGLLAPEISSESALKTLRELDARRSRK